MNTEPDDAVHPPERVSGQPPGLAGVPGKIGLWARVFGASGLHGREAMIANLVWLMADRFVRLAVGFIVGLFVARHLGPQEFGRLSYAMSLVTLLGVLVPLGLDPVVKRQIVAKRHDAGAILSSVLAVRCVAMLATLALIWILALTVESENSWVIFFASGAMIAPVAATFDLWLESRWFGRMAFGARVGASLGGALVRLAFLLLGAPVEAFAAAASVEAVLLLGALVIAVWRCGQEIGRRLVDRRLVKEMLRESWPLLAAGVAVTIYGRIDQVMLDRFLGKAAVGTYSAAVKLSELAHFLPMVVASTAFPSLVRIREAGPRAFAQATQRFYDLNCVVGMSVAACWSVGAAFWVRLAYGPEFVAAGPVLAVHAWASVFVFLGVARSHVLSIEGQMLVQLATTVIGAVVNITLNLMWIPRYGGVGAAWATVAAQASAAWLSLAMFRASRTAFVNVSVALVSPIFGWPRILGKSSRNSTDHHS